MKKRVLSVLLILMILITPMSSFGTDGNAKVTPFPVYFNGELIDNAHATYPLLVYRDITYFPMTWDFSVGLGLSTTYSNESGLVIEKSDSSSVLKQSSTGQNDFSTSYQIEMPAFPITVNGKKIDNSKEQYPIFVFRGITYFPLTWHYVVDEFGWKSEYSNENGLKISSAASNVAVETKPSEEVDPFEGYTLIEVDGGDLSGYRKPNVVVDIGFGDRDYYAFTNEHGQLVKVTAKEIVLQDESTEPVLSNGRYYRDEAKVPGTESATLDEGHVIADSLGGVANAYNITPQNSTLNRHGDQAYMEKVIRDAGGCTDFTAIVTYPNTTTQIPSHYSYTYTLNGNVIHDEFDNVNPDEVNATLEDNITEPAVVEEPEEQYTVEQSAGVDVVIVSVSLKNEEIVIKNAGDGQIDLNGYVIVSVTGGQRFYFPSYILEPGETVTVYARGGRGDLKWSGNYIWNNDGDPAELYDPDGVLVDEHYN